jgi:hypothetical protein
VYSFGKKKENEVILFYLFYFSNIGNREMKIGNQNDEG